MQQTAENIKGLERRRALIALGKAVAAVGVVTIGGGSAVRLINSENRRLLLDYQAYLDEKNKTGGFVVSNTTPGIKQVRLLDSGKTSRNEPDDVFVIADRKDTRNETLAAAIGQIGEQCEVVGTTAVTEQTGWGSATSGLIVQVRNCK